MFVQCGAIIFVLLGILQSCLHVSAVITVRVMLLFLSYQYSYSVCCFFVATLLTKLFAIGKNIGLTIFK